MNVSEELELAKAVEAALLSGCLMSAHGLDDAAAALAEEDFGWAAHRLIFRTCLELQQQNCPVDSATVYERLVTRGFKHELGPEPLAYFANLILLDPTGASVRYNVEKVRGFALRRTLRHTFAVLDRDLESGMPGPDILASAEEAILTVGEKAAKGETGPRPLRQLVRESIDRIDSIQSGTSMSGAVESGYLDVDALIGGFRPCEMSVVAARTSVGKTSFGLGVALNVAARQEGVLFYTFEMSEASISDRIIAMISGVSYRRFTDHKAHLAQQELSAIIEAQRYMESLPLYVHDVSGRTATQLLSESRRFLRRNAVKLIVVDYLQFVRAENDRDARTNQVGLISRRLNEMAHACNVPVLAAAQINRAAEDRQGGKPRLADLRESGSIEQDASVVLLLHRPADQADHDPVMRIEANVAKNRNGPTGEVTLAFRKAASRFENSAPGY